MKRKLGHNRIQFIKVTSNRRRPQQDTNYQGNFKKRKATTDTIYPGNFKRGRPQQDTIYQKEEGHNRIQFIKKRKATTGYNLSKRGRPQQDTIYSCIQKILAFAHVQLMSCI
jgi:hypothetical protein